MAWAYFKTSGKVTDKEILELNKQFNEIVAKKKLEHGESSGESTEMEDDDDEKDDTNTKEEGKKKTMKRQMEKAKVEPAYTLETPLANLEQKVKTAKERVNLITQKSAHCLNNGATQNGAARTGDAAYCTGTVAQNG